MTGDTFTLVVLLVGGFVLFLGALWYIERRGNRASRQKAKQGRRHPVGAALQIGFGVLILLVFILYVIFQAVSTKLMSKLPDWATNSIAGAILFIWICWAVYAWVVKRRRQGS